MPKIFYLICGYRGSGKDSLYKWFCRDRTVSFEHSWKRMLFTNIPCEHLIDSNTMEKTVKIGLADSVKRDVLTFLQLPMFNHEAYKDKPLTDIENVLKITILPNLNLDKTQSLRDLYISVGTKHKMTDINYWCEKAHQDTIHDEIVCITDWRFVHELDYFKERGTVITVRVFRKDVPIPRVDVESEHSLDEFKTDLVYVPETNFEDEKTEFLKLFPQYV